MVRAAGLGIKKENFTIWDNIFSWLLLSNKYPR
jgi:hypothetical protein